MLETRTRLQDAIPAERSASSKLVSRSRCLPTPLVRNIRLGTNISGKPLLLPPLVPGLANFPGIRQPQRCKRRDFVNYKKLRKVSTGFCGGGAGRHARPAHQRRAGAALLPGAGHRAAGAAQSPRLHRLSTRPTLRKGREVRAAGGTHDRLQDWVRRGKAAGPSGGGQSVLARSQKEIVRCKGRSRDEAPTRMT